MNGLNSGLRQSGKSTLFEIFANNIIQSGVPANRVQQYNFEKPVFPLSFSWFDIYKEILGKTSKETMNYIFLDEPQQIPEFERLIDALYVEKFIDLYITGSNAYFLSGDLATLLSGRYISVHILPFSFKEYSESQHNTTLSKYELFNNYLNGTSLPSGRYVAEPGCRYSKYVYSGCIQYHRRKRHSSTV